MKNLKTINKSTYSVDEKIIVLTSLVGSAKNLKSKNLSNIKSARLLNK